MQLIFCFQCFQNKSPINCTFTLDSHNLQNNSTGWKNIFFSWFRRTFIDSFCHSFILSVFKHTNWLKKKKKITQLIKNNVNVIIWLTNKNVLLFISSNNLYPAAYNWLLGGLNLYSFDDESAGVISLDSLGFTTTVQ